MRPTTLHTKLQKEKFVTQTFIGTDFIPKYGCKTFTFWHLPQEVSNLVGQGLWCWQLTSWHDKPEWTTRVLREVVCGKGYKSGIKELNVREAADSPVRPRRSNPWGKRLALVGSRSSRFRKLNVTNYRNYKSLCLESRIGGEKDKMICVKREAGQIVNILSAGLKASWWCLYRWTPMWEMPFRWVTFSE